MKAWLYYFETFQASTVINTWAAIHTHTHSYKKNTSLEWLLNYGHQRIKNWPFVFGTFGKRNKSKRWRCSNRLFFGFESRRRRRRGLYHLIKTIGWWKMQYAPNFIQMNRREEFRCFFFGKHFVFHLLLAKLIAWPLKSREE